MMANVRTHFIVVGGLLLLIWRITHFFVGHVRCKTISIDVSPDDKFIWKLCDVVLTLFRPQVKFNKGNPDYQYS